MDAVAAGLYVCTVRRLRHLVLPALLAIAGLALPGGARAAPDDVTVMTFNVWLGGDVVDFGKVGEVISRSGADIVGLQEAEGNTRRIAASAGWPYWSDRLHVVSRFPLIDPPEARGRYVLAQIRPGQVFALGNVHLTSDPYGPDAVQDGRTLAAGAAAGAHHAPAGDPRRAGRAAAGAAGGHPDASDRRLQHALAPRLDARGRRAARPGPLPGAVAGDRGDRRGGVPGRLPRDPSRPGRRAGHHLDVWHAVPAPRARPAVDRIDMVHASRGLQVLDSGIAGPPGTPDVTWPVDPYPSDHRAVAATVRLTPAAPGNLVSVIERRVTRGARSPSATQPRAARPRTGS